MSRSELVSNDGEERLRRLSISVVRTLWGDHEGRCNNKSCALCLAASEDEICRRAHHSLVGGHRASQQHEPPDTHL